MSIQVKGYIVERSLGTGRTGEVFLARRQSDAIKVAVRRLAPSLAREPGVPAAQTGHRAECSVLRSPVLVPVTEVITQDDELFIVESFVEGMPLSRKLARGAVPPEEVHALAMDLMDGLSELHRQRVVHGDIRPSNVFLTSKGARLLGIGVAHRAKRRKGTGGFLLRDPYDAPEMDQGVASHLTDIYALGALLMHAITGEEGPYDFLSETDEVMDELLKAMSAAPEHRHGNIEGLRLAFTDAEKRRGPVRQRAKQEEPVVVSSWTPTDNRRAKPQEASVPWPEEDDVATRVGLPAMDAQGKPLKRPTVSVLGVEPPPPKAVSARKEGTVAPGERFEELLDRARPWIPVAGGVTGLIVLGILILLLLPEQPDGMVFVEPVPTQLGDAEGQRDERPGFQVAVSPFWLDKVEVTGAAYAACVDEGKCTLPGVGGAGDPDLPVTGVTWLQAQAYCTFVDGRLPTENEWETAARSAGRYPWGDTEPGCERARYGVLPGGPCASEDGAGGAVPGPDLEAMEEGAFAHLAGNVWELVDADHLPERGPGTGEATVAGQSALRVIKGGAWSAGPEHLRPAARIGVRTDYAAEDVGFRCARSDE